MSVSAFPRRLLQQAPPSTEPPFIVKSKISFKELKKSTPRRGPRGRAFSTVPSQKRVRTKRPKGDEASRHDMQPVVYSVADITESVACSSETTRVNSLNASNESLHVLDVKRHNPIQLAPAAESGYAGHSPRGLLKLPASPSAIESTPCPVLIKIRLPLEHQRSSIAPTPPPVDAHSIKFPSIGTSSMSERVPRQWSRSEVEGLQRGLANHGKDFAAIDRNFGVNQGDVVEYYYLHKHDVRRE
jgi:hypothetical protein